MKCEHGKEVKVIILYREDYTDDGFTTHLEGCDECKLEVEERFPTPTKLYRCNMADICKRSCTHREEHTKIEDCTFPPCMYNQDAACEELE